MHRADYTALLYMHLDIDSTQEYNSTAEKRNAQIVTQKGEQKQFWPFSYPYKPRNEGCESSWSSLIPWKLACMATALNWNGYHAQQWWLLFIVIFFFSSSSSFSVCGVLHRQRSARSEQGLSEDRFGVQRRRRVVGNEVQVRLVEDARRTRLPSLRRRRLSAHTNLLRTQGTFLDWTVTASAKKIFSISLSSLKRTIWNFLSLNAQKFSESSYRRPVYVYTVSLYIHSIWARYIWYMSLNVFIWKSVSIICEPDVILNFFKWTRSNFMPERPSSFRRPWLPVSRLNIHNIWAVALFSFFLLCLLILSPRVCPQVSLETEKKGDELNMHFPITIATVPFRIPNAPQPPILTYGSLYCSASSIYVRSSQRR